MKALYCMRCRLGWTDWHPVTRWYCPFRGCKDVIPSEEAR